jgi:hypothetical protein
MGGMEQTYNFSGPYKKFAVRFFFYFYAFRVVGFLASKLMNLFF